MENASKALLIAGAILLVIAIIAIAVGVVNKTKGTIGEAGKQIDNMEIEVHNNQFEKYEYKRAKYSEVKKAISELAAYDAKVTNPNFKVLCNVYWWENANNGYFEGTYTFHQIYSGESSYFNSSTMNSLYSVYLIYDDNGIVKAFDLHRLSQ